MCSNAEYFYEFEEPARLVKIQTKSYPTSLFHVYFFKVQGGGGKEGEREADKGVYRAQLTG